ncbi:hypothetical protein J3A83DRAFT_4355734 [Scleroderma citrinum]
MEEPEVVKCPDGHLHRAVYGLGPYIADYPEQCLLSCIVQGCDGPQSICCCHELSRAFIQSLTIKELWNDYGIVDGILPFTAKFPHADIHELIAPDILHQLIKGTFKDHLVTRIERYFEITLGKRAAKEKMAEIDHMYYHIF